jgi:hypothetical protein
MGGFSERQRVAMIRFPEGSATAKVPVRRLFGPLLVAVLAVLLAVGTASAAAPPANATRVGVVSPTVPSVVSIAEHSALGQHLGGAPTRPEIALGDPSSAATTVGGYTFDYATKDVVANALAAPAPATCTGSLQASTFSPPSRVAAEGGLPELSASPAALEAKFKHAADFGVTEGRGAAGFDAYGKAIDSFVQDPSTTRILGTYRGGPAILNYNASTAQVVVQATDGTFISGWQMNPAQLQNVIERGSLGGG